MSASSFVLEVRGGEDTGGTGLIIWELHKAKHVIGLTQSSCLECISLPQHTKFRKLEVYLKVLSQPSFRTNCKIATLTAAIPENSKKKKKNLCLDSYKAYGCEGPSPYTKLCILFHLP